MRIRSRHWISLLGVRPCYILGLQASLILHNVEFDPLTRQWSDIIGDDTLRLRKLPEELELELYIEDRRVILKSDPANMSSEKEDRRGIERYAPHVLIYSSGDMSPFEVHFVRRIDDGLIAVQGDMAGMLEIVTPEDSM